MDPEFWRPRLARLEEVPRQLAIFPRHDLSRPGIEVVELRLRAHDGARLGALLARSAFAERGSEVHVRPVGTLAEATLDLATVEEGGSDLLFEYPHGRRLEDRVLDVLRIVGAACSLEGVACEDVTFPPPGTCQDEFAIVRFLRQEGWTSSADS